MRGIVKTFGAVRALRRVDLDVGHGEIVGLVGDNAAGKSTLMKVLSGVCAADAGEILIAGAPARLASPMDARAAGIEMVYQDFALVPELSVTQNIFLGREVTRELLGFRFLNQPAMARAASELFARLGLRAPAVDTPVRTLSGGQQQAVAIGARDRVRCPARDHG
jgi:ABC-type sugar transport system ATPase subunit